MSFKDVIGQEKAISILKNALLKNRIAHAYLFQGPRGVGKEFSALNFAKAINCLSSSKDGNCCDECESCRKIESGNHIDVSVITLPKGRQSIPIDQIRKLQSQAALKPYEAGYKVFCIRDAELMNDESQSALLKTLEEPPSRSILILTTSSPPNLLTTIISRCQAVKFSPLNIKSSADILARRYKMDKDASYFMAHISQSGLLDTGLYAQQDILKEKNRIIDEFWGFLDSPHTELSFLKESGENVLWALSALLWWYRDMLVFKETFKADNLANRDRIQDIEAGASRYSALKLGRIISVILKTIAILDETNVSLKLALTVMAVDILNEVRDVSGNTG